VLRDGRLQQCDEPRAVYARPANVFVAGFIGSPSMNLLEAEVKGAGCELNGVRLALPADAAAAASGRGHVIVGLRPDALELAPDGLAARVEVVEDVGAEAYAICRSDTPGGERRVIARVDSRRPPVQGETVHLRPLGEEAHLFDPDSGERL
jgi:multiple sugar transport system ATP-binding protein